MSAVDLLAPVLADGIHLNNFFNGRLLSAEDLRAEQAANRAQHTQLGRALGAGVVDGLTVRPLAPAPGQGPRVAVAKGLALNRRGQALALPEDVEVRLVRTTAAPLPAEAGPFAACDDQVQGDTRLTGAGAYLLAVGPASGFEGSVPASGLSTRNLPGGPCGSRWAVEGVRFRLLSLQSQLEGVTFRGQDLGSLIGATDPASRSRLRSLVTHACLGTLDLLARLAEPKPLAAAWPADGLGAVDKLRQTDRLGDCDVPLAVIVWTDQGIQVVDNWAARRSRSREPTRLGRSARATVRRFSTPPPSSSSRSTWPRSWPPLPTRPRASRPTSASCSFRRRGSCRTICNGAPSSAPTVRRRPPTRTRPSCPSSYARLSQPRRCRFRRSRTRAAPAGRSRYRCGSFGCRAPACRSCSRAR